MLKKRGAKPIVGGGGVLRQNKKKIFKVVSIKSTFAPLFLTLIHGAPTMF
jgi:hypothetical protein